MIYRLKYIDEHPAYRIHEAVSWFVNQLEGTEVFDVSVFNEDFQDLEQVFENHGRVVELLEELHTCYHAIQEEDERQSVITSFNYWNNITYVCQNCEIDFILWDDLGEEIRGAFSNLFEHLYTQLTKTSAELKRLGMLRSDHYQDFWSENGKVCCCCGIRELDDPEVQLNAYDHYLHITKYPFCGVNYSNIIPICDKCNESPAKGAKHIVFSDYENRVRREAFFPYEKINPPVIDIEIDNIFPGDCTITLGIAGNSETRIQTWYEVFYIDARFKSAIKTERKKWINGLVKYSRQSLDSFDELKDEIRAHIQELNNSSRYLYQHLEVAFWNSVLARNIEIELLFEYVIEKRGIRN